jgi:hypothetical protein
MKLLCFILSITITSYSPPDFELDATYPISYLKAAEDVALISPLTKKNISYCKHLYILAGVLDPSLRESSLIGLMEVETDPILRSKLQAMHTQSNMLLVPTVVLRKDSTLLLAPQNVTELCDSIAHIRAGKKVTTLELENLRPWRYLFPRIYDHVLRNVGSQKELTSPVDILTTLRVELAITGGANVWSAEIINSKGNPVSFSLNDDLASLYNIDPTKIIRANGQWVSE